MNKKLISLLVALCLVIGLLPIMSMADTTPATAKIAIMSWSNMTVTEGGNPLYAKTVSYDGYTSAGVANGTGWKYTTAGASENDWNIKFEYPQGGTPTLTLKNAKLDQIGDDGTELYTPNGVDEETGLPKYKSTGTCTAVLPKGVNDLKIVLIGDNFIEANNGIVRGDNTSSMKFTSVTIVGEAGSSLTGTGKAIGIQAMQGAPLTIENANINLAPVANGGGSATPIYTSGGKLTIKNSTITATNSKNACINTSGDVEIENSTLNLNSTFSSTSSAGCINTTKMITVKDSTINGETPNGTILAGNGGITVNNSKLNLNSGYYAIRNSSYELQINGGEVTVVAGSNAFYSAPTLGAGWSAVAGASEDAAAEVTDETKVNGKYVKITFGATTPTQPSTTPTSAPTTAPTTAPSATTSAPSATTTAPTAAPSTAPSATTTAPTAAPSTTPTTSPTTGEKVQVAIMSWSTMTAYEGGAPMYAKTVSYEGFTEQGAANGTGWKYTTTGASENDWNIKFEWPLGGVPTVTFKDAKLDQLGNDGTTLWIPDGDGGYKSTGTCSAVLPKGANDIKIVLIGDNFIEANNGLVRGSTGANVRFKSITIVGENGGKLSGTGKAIGIQASYDASIVIENAIIDLASVANQGGSAAPIYTNNGDLTIKNSTITAANTKNSVFNINGNVTIENSTINVSNSFTSTSSAGTMQAAKKMTITDSTINGTSTNGVVLNGKAGIVINSGKLTLKSGYYVFETGDANVTINGGTVEITSDKAAFKKAPVLGTGVEGVAGPDKDNADFYDDTKYNQKYVKFEAGSTTPSNPSNPGGSTTPSNPNNPGGSTTPSTPGGTPSNPTTGDVNLTVWMAVMAISAAAFVTIFVMSKKRTA